MEWLKNGTLEIRAYPTENLHAKVYIMTFVEGDRDSWRVITGSSNFTQICLINNFEFNEEDRLDDFGRIKIIANLVRLYRM